MDAAITAVFAVFDTIAFVILVLGLFMVATGKDVMPERLRARLRRVPATPQVAAVLRNSPRCMKRTPNESRN